MKRRRSTKRSGGGTLLEVVLSLALLGTVLASMVLARGRLHAQRELARRKLRAVEAAEEFLQSAWRDPSRIPRRGEERFGEQREYVLRARIAPREGASELSCHVLALEIREAAKPREANSLVSLDLVLPGRIDEQEKEQRHGQ